MSTKVFVISGMGPDDFIVREGFLGKIVKSDVSGFDYVYVDGIGPYSRAYVFNDTALNRDYFRNFIRRSVDRQKEQGTDQRKTFNLMERV